MENKKEKITSLNRQKGYVKGQFNKLQDYIAEVTQRDPIQLDTKLNNLRKLQIKIEDLKSGYFSLIDDDSELEEIQEEILQIEEIGEEIEVSLKRLILSSSENKKNNSSDNTCVKSENNSVKLPDVPLPHYSGEYQNWYLFKKQFCSLIDSNDRLNDSQKLYYLKSALSGPALDIVTLDDSYSTLFKALELRFENKRFIANSHLNEILSYEVTSESSKSLRNLVDGCQKHIRALKTMGLELNALSEILLINLTLKKIDKESRKQYELSFASADLPNWHNFIEFLEKRCLVLENLQPSNPCTNRFKSFSERKVNHKTNALFTKSKPANKSCLVCQSNEYHPIFKCESFLKLNENQRYDVVKKNFLCLNCLSSQHKISKCQSSRTCMYCHKFHNSLLHRTSDRQAPMKASSISLTNDSGVENQNMSSAGNIVSKTLCNNFSNACKQNKVLLGTCVIYVDDIYGNKIPAKCILDGGSMSSFCTLEFANMLGLQKIKYRATISGINENISYVNSKLNACISNVDNSFKRRIDLLIIPKITELSPSHRIDLSKIDIPDGISLADPEFGKPSKIDLLLGAELFYEILESGKYISQIIFQKTVFGYIACGSTKEKSDQTHVGFTGFIQNVDNLDQNIQKFWHVENVNLDKSLLSPEEQSCEDHFLRNYKRNENGRFIVKMPLKEDPSVLGDSKQLAAKRLTQLWNRLLKTPKMLALYKEFMEEYEFLQHMKLISAPNEDKNCYYIAHHSVYKADNPSTKLRVVFDASAVTTSGKSLNDILMKGRVKEDVFDIMCRFRKYRFVFTTDIKQMYRQILIDPEQRKLLRILWKKTALDPIETYELQTVTYGTSSAPFLAIRTLIQLAMDEKEAFPLASECILRDTYMDDLLSGEDSISDAAELQSQVIKLLKGAGMSLHKWNSNVPELLRNVSSSDNEYSFCPAQETKALGILWNAESDVFTFKVCLPQTNKITKRTVLSDIARLYDPLGIIGPVIVKAKIFMQNLWMEKLDWNDPLPQNLENAWMQFKTNLKAIEDLQVPRYVLVPNSQKIILHGFADASESAYGASVYIQCIQDSHVSSNLLSSKSLIAPLKKLSIPRLELSACLLLSKLIVRILDSLKVKIDGVYLYSDSTIALAWIQTPAYRLKTFVANRVAKIQTYTEHFHWNHVSSELNPSDIISRGLDPKEIVDNSLWFTGPPFLSHEVASPGVFDPNLDCMNESQFKNELKPLLNINLFQTCQNIFYDILLNISSSYSKLIRIVSFIFRFAFNSRNPLNKKVGPISSQEYLHARNILVSISQAQSFAREIEDLKGKNAVSKNSRIKLLSPFLDENGILRVGGRLSNSNLAYDKKHPMIIPANHRLSTLIFEYYHTRDLHSGPQNLLHSVRQTYWPLRGKDLARKVVHKCIVCFKHKPILCNQVMGNLPVERVTQSHSFFHCGIDYTGPFLIKSKNQRKGSFQKYYIAVFICMSTKAIHLELVSDLTTEAFIASLKRFFARRGKASVIFCDNASNFVGAQSELKKLRQLTICPNDDLVEFFNSENITWKFIPPRAPNFGGLWEAGVKSVKHHLRRTVGETKLSLEEFLTVVTQIEGILNSRPLTPLSSDTDNFEVLTPGHFLIGRPLNAIPEPDLSGKPDNILSRWQRTTKIVQTIWKKWHKDYLSHLNQRNKWQFEKENVKPGTMVLIKEDNLPPYKWSLGRIINVIPGKDNKVRVVLLKTSRGEFKRPISKLSILPFDAAEV